MDEVKGRFAQLLLTKVPAVMRDRAKAMLKVKSVGGRGGIRTHGRVAPTPDFESGAFNHSATLPLDDSATPWVAMRLR